MIRHFYWKRNIYISMNFFKFIGSSLHYAKKKIFKFQEKIIFVVPDTRVKTDYKPWNIKYSKPLSCSLLHITVENMYEKYSMKAPKANVGTPDTLRQFCSLSEHEIFLSLLNSQFLKVDLKSRFCTISMQCIIHNVGVCFSLKEFTSTCFCNYVAKERWLLLQIWNKGRKQVCSWRWIIHYCHFP